MTRGIRCWLEKVRARFESNLIAEKRFQKYRLLSVFPPGGKTVDGRSNLRELHRKSVNRAIKCAFPGRYSFISFRAVRRFVENCRHLTYKSANFGLTSGDLTFDLTKKVTEGISSFLLTLFRTPPFPYRYVAQEPS